uniref:Uncharacterized protein n=1 Tax=Avena sativa TaxID=4498 RepID=A0ACD5V598_AVESA
MASLFPSPPLAYTDAADPVAPPSDPTTSFLPSLLIIAALLAFVLLASVSIHTFLRYLSRSSPSPTTLPRTHRDQAAAGTGDAELEENKPEGEEKRRRLIESLPRFTMASALAALPRSSPDCAVCLSPFTPEAELRLLPACRHAFHAECVDAWLRTTPTCPLCRAPVALPHPFIAAILAAEPPPSPEPPSRSRDRSRSFRVQMGSVSSRGSPATATAGSGDSRTYSLGSFEYHIEEEVEAVVSRLARAVARASESVKEEKPAVQGSPLPPGETVAEAAGSPSRGWLREYVDRLASSASSLAFPGRWGSWWSQSNRNEEPWLWDTEAAAMPPPAPAPGSEDEEETAFMVLYRWIAAV